MTILNVELPNEIHEDVVEIAKQLNQTPTELMQMALSLLMQSDALNNAIEAMERSKDGKETIALPLAEAQQETDIAIGFHPEALVEFNSLSEEDQLDVLSELIEHIGSVDDENNFDETITLVINETDNSQTLLSSLDYGDIVYKVDDNALIIYLMHFPDLMADDSDIFGEADEKETELHS